MCPDLRLTLPRPGSLSLQRWRPQLLPSRPLPSTLVLQGPWAKLTEGSCPLPTVAAGALPGAWAAEVPVKQGQWPRDLDEGWGGQLVVDRAQPLDGVGGVGRHV